MNLCTGDFPVMTSSKLQNDMALQFAGLSDLFRVI